MQTAIPATWMRGGTSKGLFFHAHDLPLDVATRDAVLLAVMGSPDVRQIDGVGGAHPLTSKVAVLCRSQRPDADVDYLFLQVAVDRAEVIDVQNCGNILAAVGPWAIENGLVDAQADRTLVRVHMVNTGSIAVASVCTPGGKVIYTGSTVIDGVPGSAAPISLDFLDVAGGTCGSLLPTGNAMDIVDGVSVTCIDNGMPVVLIRAVDLDRTGHESIAQLEQDTALKQRLESIRLAVGSAMNLGQVLDKTVPKMCLVSAPENGGSICTRSFIPHRVHDAIGVLGALSVATACVIPGTVADGLARMGLQGDISVEHPSGFFSVAVDVEHIDGKVHIKRSALMRTARKIFHGEVYLPKSIWPGAQAMPPVRGPFL